MEVEQPAVEGTQVPPTPGAAPETPQAKPWWEARGFKSEGEGIAAIDASQSTLSKLQEEHAATKRTLEVVMSARPAEPAAPKAPEVPGYRRYLEGKGIEEAYNSGDPLKFSEAILSAVDPVIRERATALYQQQEDLRQIRRTFYAENKDLEPYTDLVGYYSGKVLAESPNATVEQAMKEIAKRTRAQVAAIKSGKGPTLDVPPGAPQPREPLPHLGSGSPSDAPPAPPVPKPEPTAHDDVAAEIKRRNDLKQSKAALR